MKKLSFGIAKILTLVGVGIFAGNISWTSLKQDVVDYFEKPTFTEFQELFVSDMGTVYTSEEYRELMTDEQSAFIRNNPTNAAMIEIVCPKTGSTNFQRVIARAKKGPWGDIVGYELAEDFQAKQRVIAAKGDLTWSKFLKIVEETRDEGDKVTDVKVPSPQTVSLEL